MKNIFSSLIPKKFPKMDNRGIPPSFSLRIRKQKPMKRTIINNHKKKHRNDNLFMNKVVSYLKSDSYMYNTLLSPQPTSDCPPPKELSTLSGCEEEMVLSAGEGKRKKMEKVVDFLKADCYMYSPLTTTSNQVCSKSPTSTPGKGHVRFVTEESRECEVEERERQGKAREERNSSRARKKVVTKSVAYREAVKHIVQQNCCSSSVQGR